jgi:hypothetical protein
LWTPASFAELHAKCTEALELPHIEARKIVNCLVTVNPRLYREPASNHSGCAKITRLLVPVAKISGHGYSKPPRAGTIIRNGCFRGPEFFTRIEG